MGKTGSKKQERSLQGFIKIIHLTERISAKIHGLAQKSDIFGAIMDEFRVSGEYTGAIFLLSEEGSSLKITGTSLPPKRVSSMEKLAGLSIDEYRIDLSQSQLFRKAALEGQTIQENGKDIISELFAETLASPLIEMIDVPVRNTTILTPLYHRENIIGVFAMTSPEMSEEYAPSVRNLARYISIALEFAEERNERRNAEEALLEREQQFRALVERINDAIFASDQDGAITYVSPAIESIAGYHPSELIGKNFSQIVYEEDLHQVINVFNESLEGNPVRELECRVIAKSGEPRWVRASGHPIDIDGSTAGFRGVISDIEERKQAEEALRLSESYFKLLIENSPDMIVVLNQDATIRYVSPSLEKIAAYSAEDLIGKYAFDFVHPEDRERAVKLFEESRLNPGSTVSIEMRLLESSGRWGFVEMAARNLLDDPIIEGVVLNFHNIDERKQAEKTSKESEAKYRALFDNAGTPITYFDLNGEILLINNAGAENLGMKPEALVGKSIYQTMPDIAETVMERIRLVSETGSSSEYEENVELPTGSRWFLSSLQPVRDLHGNVFGVQIVSHDITERKNTERRIERLNAMLRAMRDVHELILREEDRDSMVQGACDILTNTEVCQSSAILLVDDFGAPISKVVSGESNSLLPLYESAAGTDYPPCVIEALEHRIKDADAEALVDCDNCHLSNRCIQRNGIFQRMEYFGRTYGLLGVSIASNISIGGEEYSLLEEIAANLAFAIQETFMEEERTRAEEVLRESEDRFREVADNASDAIIHLDYDGSVIDVNERVEAIFGYSRQELIGVNLADFNFIMPEQMPGLVERLNRIMEGSQDGELIELTALHKDGSTVFVEVSVGVIRKKGNIQGLLIIGRDITSRKLMEERINQYSEELEQKLAELQVAYERLKELDKMKDGLLSTVSHELRTPLTSIKSFAEILLTYDNDEETQTEFLNIINDESDRLTRLINDFLDLSKIESGRIEWQTTIIDVPEIVESAVNSSEVFFDKMNLSLTMDIPSSLPAVWGDRDRYIQVITNLLSNAAKFSPEGGEVRLVAETIQGNASGNIPDSVKISVIDKGRGIAPEDQETIFQKFTQVGDTLRDKPPGTGLGLAICKEILEHYNGNIWVESELGKGSTFSFTIPVASFTSEEKVEAEEREAAAESIPADPGKNRILIVDDEKNIRRFIKHELTQKGYDVIEAAGGRETIEMARRYCPDLITLDVMLPDINGYEVATELRKDPDTMNIPILIISVLDENEDDVKAGANGHITKPCSGELILERVNELLQNPMGTILVVDDDKTLVKSISYELEQRGYSTCVAHDGEEAVKIVKARQPDLIILDIMMPKMDGHQVIKMLRQREDTGEIPIIVLTGVEINGGRVKAIELGATDYLTKSGGLSELFEKASNILTGRRTVRE